MHNLGLQNPPKKSYEKITKCTKRCYTADLRAMRSTPTNAIEVELSVTPIDLHLKEL